MWENNGSVPRSDVLVKIAEYYNVPKDYLLGNNNASESPTDAKLNALQRNLGKLNEEELKKAEKEYEVTIDIPVTATMVEEFKKGVNLNDGECKAADLEITGEYTANVTLTEGRYHQIKRMFGCFGAKVLELNRIRIGNLYLGEDLKLGEVKEATENELQKIQERN